MHAEESSVNKLAIRQHAIILGDRHYEINSYLCYDMPVNTYNMSKVDAIDGCKVEFEENPSLLFHVHFNNKFVP